MILCFYRGQLESSVWEEKRFNPRLTKSIEAFVELMDNLNLPYPKKIGKLRDMDQYITFIL